MKPSHANTVSNIPAFLSKLWKMVNDPDTDDLISWSANGHHFIIQNEAQFWYKLLPIYYKHNNMSSFIRQLNMYGFHKVPELGGMESDKEEIKFFHPFFRRDQVNLLKHIKRKISSSKMVSSAPEESKPESVEQITKVLVDVKHLRGRQESVDSQLAAMKNENAALWRELALLRQKHMKQQQIVNKLIQFLVTIVQPSRASGLSGLGVKRRYPLMIERDPKMPKTERPDGPTIHEIETESNLTDNIYFSDDINQPGTPLENIGQVDSPQSLDNNDGQDVLLDIPLEVTDSDEAIINPAYILGGTDLPPSEEGTVEELLAESNLINSDNEKESEFPEVIIGKDVMTANEFIDLNSLNAYAQSREEDPPTEKINITNIKQEPSEKLADKTKSKNTSKADMTVATRNLKQDFKMNSSDVFFSEDLDSHLETTQGEIDSIKEMLFDGCSLDANALLGLFNSEDSFPMDVPQMLLLNEEIQNSSNALESSSSEVAKYNSPLMLDFYNLFDETTDTATDDVDINPFPDTSNDGQVNTPVNVKKQLVFPKPENA